jgi:hypothetical protein
MTEKLLREVTELVREGATVIGQKPVGTFGLTDYPQNDSRVATLADELWGDVAAPTGERIHGKGRIIWGKQPEEVLAAKGISPDFVANMPLTENHRQSDEADIYFIANPTLKNVLAQIALRAEGIPEIWFPESGKTIRAPAYRTENGVTRLLLPLASSESVFVVFPRKTAAKAGNPIIAVTHNKTVIANLRDSLKSDVETQCLSLDAHGLHFLENGNYELLTASGKKIEKRVTLKEPFELSGAWSVSFPDKEITFDRLISWSDSPDETIKYFSGTAIYRKTVKLPDSFLSAGQRLKLDLGQVDNLAELVINGRELGVLWTLQKIIDVTDVLDPKKENTLEIRVTNLWPNRLIGDARFPSEPERNPDGTLKQWPQWILEGKPDPSGRQTFCMWNLWAKDDALIPSGLIGPVRLIPELDWRK